MRKSTFKRFKDKEKKMNRRHLKRPRRENQDVVQDRLKFSEKHDSFVAVLETFKDDPCYDIVKLCVEHFMWVRSTFRDDELDKEMLKVRECYNSVFTESIFVEMYVRFNS
jgi:hypothetical protein